MNICALQEARDGYVILYLFSLEVLNELYAKHLLTTEEYSKVARKGGWKWSDRLAQVLLAKPAEGIQRACQVLKEHGYPVDKKLKSEFYVCFVIAL